MKRILFSVLVIIFIVGNASAQMYHWTDGKGVKHWTNDKHKADADARERQEVQSSYTNIDSQLAEGQKEKDRQEMDARFAATQAEKESKKKARDAEEKKIYDEAYEALKNIRTLWKLTGVKYDQLHEMISTAAIKLEPLPNNNHTDKIKQILESYKLAHDFWHKEIFGEKSTKELYSQLVRYEFEKADEALKDYEMYFKR